MVASIPELTIYAGTLQSLLYGVAVLMFVLTMWILVQNRSRQEVNKTMILTSFLLILLATAELAVNIVRLQTGFMKEGMSHPGGTEGYFLDVSRPTYVAKSTLYNAQTLILDAAVIYRTFVVWRKWYVVVFPGLGWLALLASTVGVNHALDNLPFNSTNVFGPTTAGWIVSAYATTLVTNISATSLLAWRIWRVNSRSTGYVSTDRLSVVLHVVIESGLLYSITIIVALIIFLANSPVIFLFLDIISPIISIVFNLIVVRIGLAVTAKSVSSRTHSGHVPSGLGIRVDVHQQHHSDGDLDFERSRPRMKVPTRDSKAGRDMQMQELTTKVEFTESGTGTDEEQDTKGVARAF
ncbi:hypothetical protein BXZ70DRAFT_658531 [Cristinia sonorae]|uniref:Uncharacterized protein n=1 Tax=Cristinia sonorae TaxID=1940300 RepID=A0A8K0UG67_9AGAR|nr:hypothetical protein BXZ70DRAFT_658531 [Cristinia sonorae]